MSVPSLIDQITWTNDPALQKTVWANNVSLITQIFDLMMSGDTLFLNQENEPSIEDWYSLQENLITPNQDLVWFSNGVYQSTYRIINNTLMIYDAIGGIGKSVFQGDHDGLTVLGFGSISTSTTVPVTWPSAGQLLATFVPNYVSDRTCTAGLNLYKLIPHRIGSSSSTPPSPTYTNLLLATTNVLIKTGNGISDFIVIKNVTPGSQYKSSVINNGNNPDIMMHSIWGTKLNFNLVNEGIEIVIHVENLNYNRSSFKEIAFDSKNYKRANQESMSSTGYCLASPSGNQSSYYKPKKAYSYLEIYEVWS